MGTHRGITLAIPREQLRAPHLLLQGREAAGEVGSHLPRAATAKVLQKLQLEQGPQLVEAHERLAAVPTVSMGPVSPPEHVVPKHVVPNPAAAPPPLVQGLRMHLQR